MGLSRDSVNSGFCKEMAEIAQKVVSCHELLDKPFPKRIGDGSQNKS